MIMKDNDVGSPNKENYDFIQKQLHEQYALNNYNGLSSVVSIFVGLLAVFYAYGHVFINSAPSQCDDLVTLVISNDKYTPLALFLTTAAVCFVLLIMMHICIYQGLFQRKEQFITHAIRCKYYGITEINTELMPNADYLPSYYTPFNKDKNCWLKILQGLYGEFTKILILVYIVIVLSSTIRISLLNDHCCCFGLLVGCLLMLFGTCFYFYWKCKVQKEYQKKVTEFNDILRKRIKENNNTEKQSLKLKLSILKWLGS